MSSTSSSRADMAVLDEPTRRDRSISLYSNEKQAVRALLLRGRVATLQTCKGLAVGPDALPTRRRRPTLRRTTIEWAGGRGPARPERIAS